ncbi:hypothetical protein AB0933_32550 [Streptomyces venezuelae]|uniref:hypothetical protein n=1 Tax=Streptomyces venezuelae TaxID=54571 RepID=UPI003452EFDB
MDDFLLTLGPFVLCGGVLLYAGVRRLKRANATVERHLKAVRTGSAQDTVDELTARAGGLQDAVDAELDRRRELRAHATDPVTAAERIVLAEFQRAGKSRP